MWVKRVEVGFNNRFHVSDLYLTHLQSSRILFSVEKLKLPFTGVCVELLQIQLLGTVKDGLG